MSEKALSKERSRRRWCLVHETLALLIVLGATPLTVLALEHPLLGANPAVLRLERWNQPYLIDTALATGGWLAAFLCIRMGWSVWQIYELMGVHLKNAPAETHPTPAASRASQQGARRDKPPVRVDRRPRR